MPKSAPRSGPPCRQARGLIRQHATCVPGAHCKGHPWPEQVWRHRIGTDPEADELVYHEEDEAFYMTLMRSRSSKLIFIDISALPLPAEHRPGKCASCMHLPVAKLPMIWSCDHLFLLFSALHQSRWKPRIISHEQQVRSCADMSVSVSAPKAAARHAWLPRGIMPTPPARMPAGSSITAETLFLDADEPGAPPRGVLPRRSDHECTSSHRGDHLVSVLRDPEKPNSEVVVSPVADPSNTTACPPGSRTVMVDI